MKNHTKLISSANGDFNSYINKQIIHTGYGETVYSSQSRDP